MMKILLLVIGTLVLSGCSMKQDQQTEAGRAGLANPASVYCHEKGGKTEMVNTANGVSGVCVLPDGERVDEWVLFRRDHGGEAGRE